MRNGSLMKKAAGSSLAVEDALIVIDVSDNLKFWLWAGDGQK